MRELDFSREEKYKQTAKELASRLYTNFWEDYLKLSKEYEIGVPMNRILKEILREEYPSLLKEEVKNG